MAMVGVCFFGERVLVEFRREKVDGSVGGVAGLSLKQREGQIERATQDFRFEEAVDDRPSLR